MQLVKKALGIFSLIMACHSANAAIIYSGVQNLSFTATDSPTSHAIDLAGDSLGTWDNFQLDMFPTFAAQTSLVNAPAVLAYDSQFPFIERYQAGDTMSDLFGSGTFFFYDNSNPLASMFANQTGYAGLMLGDFAGTKFFGWMQISVSGYEENNTDNRPTLTIIDWAFSTTANERLVMGQIPEPPLVALILLSLIAIVRRTR